MRTGIARLWREQDGQDVTEYALILVLISLAAVASVQSVADAIGDIFTNAADAVSGV